MNDATKRPLPHGWRWVRLGEVCEFFKGVSFDNQDIGWAAHPRLVGALAGD